MNQDIDLEIVGQIVTAIGLLQVFPTEDKAGEFLVALLTGVPGCNSTGLCIRESIHPIGLNGGKQCSDCFMRRKQLADVDYYDCELANLDNRHVYPLETSIRLYGYLILSIDNSKKYELYEPFVRDFGNAFALFLENRWQQKVLIEAGQLLERRVMDRTIKLQESEERIRAIIEQTHAGYFFIDNAGLFQSVNKAWLHMHGYESADEILGQPFSLTQPETDMQVAQHRVSNLLAGESVSSGEASRLCKDGSIRYHTFSAYPVIQMGEIVGLEGFIIDTTERRLAQDALQESEARFSSAFKYAAIGIALVSPEGQWLKVNQSICDLLGYSADELLTRTFQDITHPEDLDIDMAYVKQLLAGVISTYQMEKRYFHKSGRIVWVMLSVSMVRDAFGCPLYFVSQIQNITDRKHAQLQITELNEELEHKVDERTAQLNAANMELEQEIIKHKQVEEALRESEERFREVLENSLDASYKRNLKNNTYDYLSPVFAQITGYTPNEFKNLPTKTVLDLIHPDDIVEVASVIEESLSGAEGTPYKVEYRMKHKDGEYRWLQDQFIVIRDAQGQPAARIGSVKDITNRKQAEETLNDHRWRLESIIDGTRAGTWEWNVQTGETVFNERWAQILGYTLDELSPVSIKTWENLGHPDDLIQSNELLERHLSGELPYYDCECRMKHKDGHWVWVNDRGRLITRTIDGKPLMMFGIHIDITERKQAEETQRMAERDHHIAEIYQKTAMPSQIPTLPAGYEIGTKYLPALQEAEVCGDFFDVFNLGDGIIGISIGDIVGKGLLAAMRITVAKNMIKSYAFLYNEPSKVMSLVNDALSRDIAMENDMLTAFFAVLDTRNNTLTYSNAGHETPVVRRADGNVELLKLGGMMFCGMSKQTYLEGRLILRSGDVLACVTDGISEASIDKRSEQFATDGIIRCISEYASASAEQISNSILEEAIKFANGHLHDDAATVVIKKSNESA